MTPEQINKIVDTIISLRDNDKRMQEATDAYFKVMHPDSYAPSIAGNCDTALKILEILHPDIAQDISYFIYEVPLLKMNDTEYDVIVTENGKEWKLNTVDELKTFLISEYALKQKAMEALEENKEILKNLKKRTDAEYNFTGQTQRDYDKGQIDILERILPKFTELF